ncbi:MAG: DNA double-strand break repair nuclease NurA [Desulfurococcaceae archaeon]
MKTIAEIMEDLRNRVIEGHRLKRDEAANINVELVEYTNPQQVDIMDEKYVKTINRQFSDIFTDQLYALDSSSRVLETPYVFIGIGAGSVLNRFTGASMDIPSINSILGLEEPPHGHIVIIPEVEGYDISKLREKTSHVICSNPEGVVYTPSYNRNILLTELRLMIENSLLKIFLEKRGEASSVLLIDGPLIYPLPLEFPGSDYEKQHLYMNSLRKVNKERAMLIDKLHENRVLVIGVVKRLHRSYLLSTLDPMGLASGRINDEAYIASYIMQRNEARYEPLVIGPFLIKHRHEYGVNRVIWYIAMPRRLFPAMNMGNYVFYRIEVLDKGIDEDFVIGVIAYDSVNAGTLLPLSIIAVDQRVKKLTNAIMTYILYLAGLSRESTMQYISIA